jgi:hypothetical protein
MKKLLILLFAIYAFGQDLIKGIISLINKDQLSDIQLPMGLSLRETLLDILPPSGPLCLTITVLTR